MSSLTNRPGLPSIDYRVGTYPTFLRASLDEVTRDPALSAWTARRDDYGIVLLQLWAYVADVLTFYQERIANEAYLRTAVERESVLRLAELIDYRPAPGIAAVVPLVLTTDPDSQLDVPEGLLVQSVPGQDEKPQKFETIEELRGLASLNEMRALAHRVARRFDRSAFLPGNAATVRPGDYVAFVGPEVREDAASDRWDVRRVVGKSVGPEPRTVTLRWERGLGRAWPPAPTSSAPVAYQFREQAWPFGYDVPPKTDLHDWQIGVLRAASATDGEGETVAFPPALDHGDPQDATLPQDPENPDRIFLDRVYPGISPESWVALVTHAATDDAPRPGDFYAELYFVREVTEVVRCDYGITAKVTRLTVRSVTQARGERGTVRQPENIDYFPVQGTTILVVSEPLGPALVPEEDPVSGTRLVLYGQHPDLTPGRRIVVQGVPGEGQGDQAPVAESATVSDVQLDDGTTVVTLSAALVSSYLPATVRVFGNVVRATHGETVDTQVLGDGDMTARFPSFRVRRSPVTFVPVAGAPHGAAPELDVRVDRIQFTEIASLLIADADDRSYEHRVQADGTSVVTFGDGVCGAVPQTGRGNVTARYRVGLGREGNVPSGTIRTLLD